jgi:hypothetical protein
MSSRQRPLFQLKAMLYNSAISPRLYWILQSLPFLHLGERRFHPLSRIDVIDAGRLAKLPANVRAYQVDEMKVQNGLANMLVELDLSMRGMIDLATECKSLPTHYRVADGDIAEIRQVINSH